jgi:SH3-like domain-containing protein
MEKHIKSTEMWRLRRMMRIPWTARKTNTEILTEANEQKHIIADLRRRQVKFIANCSCSSKEKAEGHGDNKKNIWKTRQRKTTRKDTGQLDQMDEEEDCN